MNLREHVRRRVQADGNRTETGRTLYRITAEACSRGLIDSWSLRPEGAMRGRDPGKVEAALEALWQDKPEAVDEIINGYFASLEGVTR